MTTLISYLVIRNIKDKCVQTEGQAIREGGAQKLVLGQHNYLAPNFLSLEN